MRLNPMIRMRLLATGLLFLFIPLAALALDNEAILFLGRINSNNINIRSDSTVSSKVICTVNKGDRVQVVKESYGWYKIMLPKRSPSFIRKDFVGIIDAKTAKVIKDNVNIRFQPDELSAILGKAGKNEVINILGENGEWYKIEPIANSFGWINNKFVDKLETAVSEEAAKPPRPNKNFAKSTEEEPSLIEEPIIAEGIIRPYGKVIARVASHKLITKENKVFLLKGNKEALDSLNYQKVKITGKLIHPKGQKNLIIEIEKIEALD